LIDTDNDQRAVDKVRSEGRKSSLGQKESTVFYGL